MAHARGLINRLSKMDICEIRAFSRPPEALVKVFEAVRRGLLQGPQAEAAPDDEFNAPRWKLSMMMLSQPADFVRSILDHDIWDADGIESLKTHFDEENFLNDPETQPELCKRKSAVCHALCVYLRAVYALHQRKTLDEAPAWAVQSYCDLVQRMSHVEAWIDDLGVDVTETLMNARAAMEPIVVPADEGRAKAVLMGTLGSFGLLKHDSSSSEEE